MCWIELEEIEIEFNQIKKRHVQKNNGRRREKDLDLEQWNNGIAANLNSFMLSKFMYLIVTVMTITPCKLLY